ncbi:MAG: thioesterase family protein [Deltaproteobacteria bacterium]|nr:thioesterase family protein [Deltaproteobacteria bacterium]
MLLPDAPLDTLVTPTPRSPGLYDWEVVDGWQQGRGAFGGLVVGALLRALEGAAGSPERPLRSLSVELCGPALPGPSELRVEVLRAGTGVTTAACRLVQGGEVQAHAVGAFGKARPHLADGRWHTPPQMGVWRALPPLPVEPPLGPVFARWFDFRTDGPLPLSGEAVPQTHGWIFPKTPGPTRDAALVAACADAWWPALYVVAEGIRPMATLAYTLQPVDSPAGLPEDAPFFFRSRAELLHQGYMVEFRELWGVDGRLLALNQQSIALLK